MMRNFIALGSAFLLACAGTLYANPGRAARHWQGFLGFVVSTAVAACIVVLTGPLLLFMFLSPFFVLPVVVLAAIPRGGLIAAPFLALAFWAAWRAGGARHQFIWGGALAGFSYVFLCLLLAGQGNSLIRQVFFLLGDQPSLGLLFWHAGSASLAGACAGWAFTRIAHIPSTSEPLTDRQVLVRIAFVFATVPILLASWQMVRG